MRRSFLAPLLGFLTAPAAAHAEVPDTRVDDTRPREVARKPDPEDLRMFKLTGGFGAEGFLGGAMRDLAGIGPAWNVRVGWGNSQSVTVEAGYAGSRQPVHSMDNGALTAHGAHGMLRVNIVPELVVEPFFFVGAGWSRYTVSGTPANVELATRQDNTLEFPFGIGVAYGYRGFSLDLRVGVRVIAAPDLVPAMEPIEGSEDSEMMHRYGVTVNITHTL
jgi:hypothetical protein